MTTVFLSYRHESENHQALVRRLAESLRSDKVPVSFDGFLEESEPGGPAEGWPRWSENLAETSSCVLVVCSLGWFDSYRRKRETSGGKGAALEASVISQLIYDDKGINDRMRLVVLDDFDKSQIPAALRSWRIFQPFRNPDDLVQLSKWVRQRLSMPVVPKGSLKKVLLAECAFNMLRERSRLRAHLEELGWAVVPATQYPAADRQGLLDSDLKDSLAFVQLLESYPRELGFDRQQSEAARISGKRCFLFRDDKVSLEEAEPIHRIWLEDREVIRGSFEDFKLHVAAELETLWQQRTAESQHEGPKRALVQVVVRSPNRDVLWDKVFDWIDKEPGIRSYLLEASERLLERNNSGVPCQGYLIVCDGAAAEGAEFSPRRDMEDCSEIQMRVKVDTQLPPTGLVYWPPPAPPWSRLQQVTPPRLHRIVGDSPANLKDFFDEVRRVFQ